MPKRLPVLFVLLTSAVLFEPSEARDAASDKSRCARCHQAERVGFDPAHAFGADDCAACHAGNPVASTEAEAHRGLIAFPGDLATAERACGSCHANRVSGVAGNMMQTGHGIVSKTRAVVDGASPDDREASFQALADSVADSVLRKQCASCHLGQPKQTHAVDATRDRGGGCAACHVNDYPPDAHPVLTTRVDDSRCFGCHSRSGRISLSYAGLAEVPPAGDAGEGRSLRLADGRPVERLAADVHYLAGMSCIDCHTSVGLMADAANATHQREAVDITCNDCHGNDNPRLTIDDWAPELAGMKKHLPFSADADTRFLATAKNGTPLWHIELRDDGAWLHTKNTGRVLHIPGAAPAHHSQDRSHERLACAACHSQWAPQCFGCHMEFDPEGEQWDHIARAVTRGRWSDRFWHVENVLPSLGVNDRDEVEVFVPGMIMTISHPTWNETKFVRRFAPLSPHTTGKARSCESCHRSGRTLGLGKGDIADDGDGFSFRPQQDVRRDGLPADSWTNLDRSRGGNAPLPGQRPFTPAEMQAILGAEIRPNTRGNN